jgi:translation initiation factor IF-3
MKSRRKHITKKKQTRVNAQIIASKIRLIGKDGGQIGVVHIKEGLAQAQAVKLDLVEIAPNENPPVCRIMDYGKYRFEQTKKHKQKKSSNRQSQSQLKEVKFRPHIDTHDYKTKLNKIIKFLERGDRVKITLVYRGREIKHADLGINVLLNIHRDVTDKDIAWIEQQPKMEGRQASMIIAPKKKQKNKSN